ncbi:MAG: CapA family protein [Bacillota bacterium]
MHNPSEGKDAVMALTGDCLITRRLRPYGEHGFLDWISIIRGSDISFTNLEGLLTNFAGYPAAASGGTYIVGNPEIADDLKWAGFNLFARANNHSMDWSFGGLLSTSEHLDARDMVHAGVGPNLAIARSPAYLDTAAGRVALISASSTFPAGAHAGTQRPDLPGRPGLNPLRFSRWFEVPEQDLKTLRGMSEELGLEELKRRFRRMRPTDSEEDEGVFRLGDLEFRASEGYRVRSRPDPADLEGNLRAIAGASRQADWVLFSLHSHESGPESLRAPAEFVRDFARQAIDAGAHAVIGHGPHHLRGIELYRGRPIFYSLGNFVFQNETIRWLPQDIYDRYGLPLEASPDELYDRRTDRDARGFPSDEMYWRSVIAELTFEQKCLTRALLHPVTLGWKLGRTRRGRPVLAAGEEAEDIIAEIAKLSRPYGVDVRWDEELECAEVVLD